MKLNLVLEYTDEGRFELKGNYRLKSTITTKKVKVWFIVEEGKEKPEFVSTSLPEVLQFIAGKIKFKKEGDQLKTKEEIDNKTNKIIAECPYPISEDNKKFIRSQVALGNEQRIEDILSICQSIAKGVKNA